MLKNKNTCIVGLVASTSSKPVSARGKKLNREVILTFDT